MSSENQQLNAPHAPKKDRWVIGLASIALVLATGYLLVGAKNHTSEEAQSSEETVEESNLNTSSASQSLPIKVPDSHIDIEGLQDTQIPIVSLEEEIYQRMDEMFAKPDEALPTLETPSPESIGER